MPKRVTRRQERFLRSSGSPLSPKQKARFARERHQGKITLQPKRRGKSRGKK